MLRVEHSLIGVARCYTRTSAAKRKSNAPQEQASSGVDARDAPGVVSASHILLECILPSCVAHCLRTQNGTARTHLQRLFCSGEGP